MTFAPADLQSAIERLEALSDGEARTAARQALTALLELHREGLTALLARLEGHPDEGALLHEALRDRATAGMLLLHGLHPSPSDHAGGRAPDPGLVPPERLLVGRRTGASPAERCDLCGEPLRGEHAHLLDVKKRKLTCACPACGALFDSARASYRRIRPRKVALEGLRVPDARWQALRVPVGLAFFSRSSSLGSVVAAYPGPAGAVESTVPPGAWEALLQDNPALGQMEPDVEALLVDRRPGRFRAYLVSIDQCYRLTGLVRGRWQGLGGGQGVLDAIEEFFGSLAPQAREVAP